MSPASPLALFLPLLPCAQDAIKGLLPGLMLSTPPLVQAQLSEALAIVCGHDFPRQVSVRFEFECDLNTRDSCPSRWGALAAHMLWLGWHFCPAVGIHSGLSAYNVGRLGYGQRLQAFGF